MSVTKIQIVDNVYSNWGPQMVENVEVSRMEKEDNLKLLKLKREAFEDEGEVKQEDENLHGSHGDVHGCTWVYMYMYMGVHGGVQYIMVQCSTLQYSTVQVSAVQYRESFEDSGDVKQEDENLQVSRGDENLQVSRGDVQYIEVQYNTVQYITVQVSAVQYSAVQYREEFEEAGDVKRENEDLNVSRGGSRGGIQYIVVQCSTVQYSTVHVSAVRYRDYKKDGQWTRRNEGQDEATNPVSEGRGTR